MTREEAIRLIGSKFYFREAKCPICQHVFMYRKDLTEAYEINAKNVIAYNTRCTACKAELLLIDDIYEAARMSDFVCGDISEVISER